MLYVKDNSELKVVFLFFFIICLFFNFLNYCLKIVWSENNVCMNMMCDNYLLCYFR